jgi:hypothetical protein
MGLQDVGYTEGSGKDVATIEKSEGGVTRQIERVALDADQLNFGASLIMDAQGSPPVESTGVDCTGKSQLVFKITYSTATDTGSFRVRFEDYQGTPLAIYTQAVTIANTGKADGARYFAEALVVNNPGAKTAKLVLDSISGGNASAYGCAI